MIFFMQAGFVLIECGSVRKKNSSAIIIKNVFDSTCGCITFWLIGYSFAFGSTEESSFIGGKREYYASSGFYKLPEDNFTNFLFQFSFANTCATIVSGCLAERVRVDVYIASSILMSALVYPIVAHWTWGNGWL